VQHRRAAVAPLEARRQRLEQTRQHERQRLEPLDRPLQLQRRLEPLLFEGRHQRPDIVAARDRLPDERLAAEPRREIPRRQRRQLAERLHAPAPERR